MVNRITKKIFMAFFYGCGSAASWLVEPLRGGGLLLLTKVPEIHGSCFINHRRMKV